MTEQYYKSPDEFWKVRQLYWHLRYRRAYDLAARRRYYRLIEVERAKLIELGFSQEHVRLYCRFQARPEMKPALERLIAYERAAADYLVEIARIRKIASRASPHCSTGQHEVDTQPATIF